MKHRRQLLTGGGGGMGGAKAKMKTLFKCFENIYGLIYSWGNILPLKDVRDHVHADGGVLQVHINKKIGHID